LATEQQGTTPQLKTCSKCGLELPTTEFYKGKGRFGVISDCKACRKIWRHQYHEKNRDLQNAKNAEWHSANKEKAKELKRIYASSAAGIHIKLVSRSARGGAQVRLSRKQFMEWYDSRVKTCEYCGITPELFSIVEPQFRESRRLTIDRKDNLKPYEVGNLVLACARCNYVKGAFFSYEEMLTIGRVISNKWKEKLSNPVGEEDA
jgi:hypothetical protein